jgi:pimeloyl-ACP methyl ester carboxylesterase
VSKLGPEPVRPQSVPLSLDRKSQDLPRHAILTADDRTIPPNWQASLAAGLPRVCITTMPCGHSPFFAAPPDLARRLIGLARGMG